MYSRVLRSYIWWFRAKGMASQSVGMAASSLTMAMMLNLGAIVVLLALVTPINALDRPGFENFVIPVALLLWVCNYLLASRQATSLPPQPSEERLGSWGRWLGVAYLWGSLVLFMGLMGTLIVRTRW
jgi:predicted ABC-type sugar transport system permease subunit